MKSFDENYQQLNKAQRMAVDAIEGPVMVIAGPGTGKTQLLSVRVANILKKTDSDPGNILCLTFTNKAALNMRERLQQLVGPEARKVVVRTFHSFAAEIMNQYPDYFWRGARLSVAPDAVQEDIIQSILSELPTDNPLATVFAGSFTALSSVKEGLKLAKEAGLNPDELRAIITENLEYIDLVEPKLISILSDSLNIKKLEGLQAKVDSLPEQTIKEKFLLPLSTVLCESLALAIDEDLPTGKTIETGKWKRRWVQTINSKKGMFNERKRNMWWLAVADVYDQYRAALHERGYYDYSDMLVEVLEQLEHNANMLADIQERYLYVLIDEFQDTNAAQLRLAHMVADHYAANNRPNIMAVGDDDQSIFAFNGAELSNMLHFTRSYPDTKVIVLEDSYRSAQAILDTASEIIKLASDRLINRDTSLRKQLKAIQNIKGEADIQHTKFPTREHQHIAIAKRIKEQWDSGERDIAVLARKHEGLRQIASKLLNMGVPIRYDQQSNVFEHEAVRHVCLIAEIVLAIAKGDKDTTNVGLSKMLRHPMWGLKPKVLWDIALTNYSTPDYLDSLLSSNDPKLNNIGNWLVWLSRVYTDQSLPLFLEYVLGINEGQYLLSPFRSYYLSDKKLTSEYIETLSAIQLLRQLTQEFASRPDSGVEDFVRFVELNLSTGRVVANETWFASSDQAVQLLTIYKAKGLEFDTVYLIDAVESMWSPRVGGRKSPANLQLQSYGEQDDDYVRLMYVAVSRAKRAFLVSSYSFDEKGNELLPTALIANLPLTEVENPIEAPLDVLESNLRWPHLTTANEKALLADKLKIFALSPTALIDYLNVAEAGPGSFKERHLLRLPRPRSVAGSYGTAIHAALETAQRLTNTDQFELDTILDRFDAALRGEHLTPRDYDRLKSRGQELLPRILKEPTTLVPKGAQSEQFIEVSLANNARIKGKLDSILVAKEKMLIRDYKTGKPLSSFDTKDQTQMVKAWRHRTQLLFYALLARESDRFKASSIETQMLYLEAETPKQLRLTLSPTNQDLLHLEKLILVVFERILKLDFPDTSKYSVDLKGINQFEDDLISGTI